MPIIEEDEPKIEFGQYDYIFSASPGKYALEGEKLSMVTESFINHFIGYSEETFPGKVVHHLP